MKVVSAFTRICVRDLDAALEFYENILNEKAGLHVHYQEMNLDLAAVGAFLLIAGSDEALEPFRATVATILVDSLDDFRRALVHTGAMILSEPKTVPTGRNMRVRHPDGAVIEYVEHSQGCTCRWCTPTMLVGDGVQLSNRGA